MKKIQKGLALSAFCLAIALAFAPKAVNAIKGQTQYYDLADCPNTPIDCDLKSGETCGFTDSSCKNTVTRSITK